MKKQNTIKVIAMIFFISVVTAGVVSDINKNISLTAEQSQNLKDLGLENYNVTDYVLSSEENERCLNQRKYWEEIREEFNETLNKTVNITVEMSENAINTCKKFKTYQNICSSWLDEIGGECLVWEKVYYTEQEMLSILDGWEEERIKQIADVKNERDSRTKEKIREGITTIQ